ncbi:hypothetical protein C2845_PM05G03650 [Panicum miliaceum]|uniref:DUF1618 domain-containing protein n=1 Tax=Panicum miliaceum TaxID=4540 RepID=A0A3L6T229_PANMI|nr:hypothetical protein C2845_PM05G03650 [Panicum miliaceum]
MPPSARERWAILAGIPKVVATEEAMGGRRTVSSISVAFDEPPYASVLTVPSRVSSTANNLWYPYVAAADPSGMILLSATQPFTNFSCVVSYHLCDAPTGKVTAIPRHFQPMGLHGDNVGLLRRGREFMVAELRPTGDGSGRATLLCFTAGRYDWVEKKLMYFPPLDRHYFGEGVISHCGMLWWVDLSYGLLACDPFADATELFYVALPSVLDELAADPVSRGMTRCVKADQSYLDTDTTLLPQSIPAFALLHPTDPDKVYFFISSCIFVVDLRLRKVVEFSDFWMPKPPPHLKRSSHFVHVWRNDPSCRPDILPSCFSKDRFSVGPDFKKLEKRFAAAQRRSTAAKPVTFATSQSRLTAVKPDTHDKGIRLKRIRDHDDMQKEELEAKRIKMKAVFAEVIESPKKKLVGSLTMKEHALQILGPPLPIRRPPPLVSQTLGKQRHHRRLPLASRPHVCAAALSTVFWTFPRSELSVPSIYSKDVFWWFTAFVKRQDLNLDQKLIDQWNNQFMEEIMDTDTLHDLIMLAWTTGQVKLLDVCCKRVADVLKARLSGDVAELLNLPNIGDDENGDEGDEGGDDDDNDPLRQWWRRE